MTTGYIVTTRLTDLWRVDVVYQHCRMFAGWAWTVDTALETVHAIQQRSITQ